MAYVGFLKGLAPEFKKNTFYLFCTYFFALLSYPFVRASTSAIFYESYTANEYSLATFVAVVVLIIAIVLSNKVQQRIGIHNLYVFIGGFTIFFLWLSHSLNASGLRVAAFGLFATKEVYIVLLIHLCLAFSNSYFSIEQLKRLLGPIGATGSVGGILGGQLTAYIARDFGTDTVFYWSLLFIFLACTCFYQTRGVRLFESSPIKNTQAPLSSVKGIGRYIALIAGIVALSQVVIFIADLQFNVAFEKAITSKDMRTSYLGQIFSFVNLGTLFFQLLIIPYVLVRVPIKKVFYLVPFLYFLIILSGIVMGAGALYSLAGAFIFMKTIDYSVFSASKEVMYHPLTHFQKFGAKYITDMFVYRCSKALVSFVMSFFIVKDLHSLSIIQLSCLFIWIIFIVLLFKTQKYNLGANK